MKVVFTVARDGKVRNPHVIQSSGNAMADGEALKAIERASPFWPLPKGCPKTVDFEFTFATRSEKPGLEGQIFSPKPSKYKNYLPEPERND